MKKHQKEIERRRSMVLKPFKSPTRQQTAPPSPQREPRTPTIRKRPAAEEKPTTPLRSLLAQNSKRRRSQPPDVTRTPLSKTRPLVLSMSASGSNKEMQRLVQEKTQLMRQVARVKEELALLERAHVLESKNEAAVVGALIAKWQVACSAASDDLFELLKPAMEAQRQAAATERMFGSAWGATDDRHNGAVQSGEGDQNEDDADIDVAYMLRQLGIDAELF
ncbi:hypothetical protein LPJ59_002584 [Coemansia sp. RSA 2399]|nr:hypothetical protein LPJ59_002584 [Coemansia sp. RSA 2399]KAJ1903086.1 hypothetical protein LPJ81_003250 [Coemansia sp. IMI 209127]